MNGSLPWTSGLWEAVDATDEPTDFELTSCDDRKVDDEV